jgi:hypothetical protein
MWAIRTEAGPVHLTSPTDLVFSLFCDTGLQQNKELRFFLTEK